MIVNGDIGGICHAVESKEIGFSDCRRVSDRLRISRQRVTFGIAVGFISGIEVKKPKLAGKIVMIILGILEFLGVFLMTGADIL